MHEGVLLAALRRRDLGRDEISRMIKDLQPDERFVMPEQWRSVALDKTREDLLLQQTIGNQAVQQVSRGLNI